MPLMYGDKKCTLYRGDHHPAELYLGGHKIAGWAETEHTGEDWTADTVYKDKLSPEIFGRCWQGGTTGAQLLQGTDTMDNVGGELAYLTGTIHTDVLLNGCVTLKTSSAWQGYKINFSKIVARCGIVVGDVLTYSIWVKFSGIVQKNLSFTFYTNPNGVTAGTVVKLFTQNDAESLMGWQLISYAFTVTKDMLTVTNMRIESNYYESEDHATTIANCWFACPMLQKGGTATAWEPYTGGAPSPSPDYPQPILCSGGSNVFAGDTTITLPDGFGGVGEYRDRLFVDGGRAYLQKWMDSPDPTTPVSGQVLAVPTLIDITATPTGVAMLAASTAPGRVHVYSDADAEVKPTVSARVKGTM